jgi:hypothetical protein
MVRPSWGAAFAISTGGTLWCRYICKSFLDVSLIDAHFTTRRLVGILDHIVWTRRATDLRAICLKQLAVSIIVRNSGVEVVELRSTFEQSRVGNPTLIVQWLMDFYYEYRNYEY